MAMGMGGGASEAGVGASAVGLKVGNPGTPGKKGGATGGGWKR